MSLNDVPVPLNCAPLSLQVTVDMEAIKASSAAASEAGDSTFLTPNRPPVPPSICETDDEAPLSIALSSLPHGHLSTGGLTPIKARPDSGRKVGAVPLGEWNRQSASGVGADDSAMKAKGVGLGGMKEAMAKMENMSEEEMAKMVCSIENKENCMMCGS